LRRSQDGDERAKGLRELMEREKTIEWKMVNGLGRLHPKSELWIHDEKIGSVFQTLGTDENDLSYSLGYALSYSPHLMKSVIHRAYGKSVRYDSALVRLQQFGKDKGFTDFEINLDNKYFTVIEAKKGWILPDRKQLKRYLKRFGGYKRRKRRLIVLSECSDNYANRNLPRSLYRTPISAISWQEIIHSINDVYHHATTHEKFILSELKEYLKEVITMENADSNWVYVVSLAHGKPSWSEISWKDISGKKMRYFYPRGKGWPKVPPNYIAFRYDGILQTIHHVERYEVVSDMHDYLPEIKKGKVRDHYLLYLGPGFEPRKELPMGKLWSNGRIWCMLDTLFTASTIKEAGKISNKREKKMES
jgi:hypothetical protein